MGIDEIQKSHGEQFTVKQLMKTRKGIEARVKRLKDTKRRDTVINFEQLGVDRLFIDESHFYKKICTSTRKCGMSAALPRPKLRKSATCL